MLNQFSRTQLLLGAEAMEKLKGARVAVFGIGGVGGYVGIFHRVNTALDSYYLNPFNWMLFFGTGLLIRQKAQEAERSIRWSNSLGNLCVCASIVYFSVHTYFGLEMYYFSR